MNYHELKNFIAVAELLHFGRASEVCHLSASALTRSIQRLESELDQTLFIRDNRTVTLTKAGKHFQEYAVKAVREWENVCDELSGQESVQGEISIYASITAVYSLLPELLANYRSVFPEVQIELHTGAAESAIEKVVAGEIDLAVAALPDRHLARVEFLPLLKTDLVFVRQKSEDNQYEEIDLTSHPLVLPSKGLSRSRVDQWLKKKGAHRNRITEVFGNEGILAMVRLGCGIGVVPKLVLERSPFRDDVEIITKAPKLEPYVVGLCSTRQNLERSSVKALWELASEHS